MLWDIIDTKVGSAEENMRFDADRLLNLSSQPRPLLHLYEWSGASATFGHFVDPADYLQLENASTLGLQLARRPTGGGIVFHIWDMTFSVLVPAHCPEFSSNTLENYAFVNRAVLAAVHQLLGKKLFLTPTDAPSLDPSCARFCMARPTKYDVMLGGRKIAGAAQRKSKEGFLHQGTIALMAPDEEYLRQVLLPGSRVLEAMQAHTFPLLKEGDCLTQAKKELGQLLASSLNTLSLECRSALT